MNTEISLIFKINWDVILKYFIITNLTSNSSHLLITSTLCQTLFSESLYFLSNLPKVLLLTVNKSEIEFKSRQAGPILYALKHYIIITYIE